MSLPKPRSGGPRVLMCLAALCGCCCGELAGAADRPGDHAAFYVANLGLADRRADPWVERAYGVFERVRAAANVQGKRVPKLKILNSSTNPWAQALPDGYILLSQGAVHLCYREADPALGDARLAFVLGHELAHLAKDDFWHGEVYRALAGDPDAKASLTLLEETSDANPQREAEIRLKETEADDWGFVYAAVAGYPVDRLLGDGGQQDFFTYWMQQTQTQVQGDASHPAPADRAALLRSRLGSMVGDIELWRFGVRLIAGGRLDEAYYFLESFRESFPSREVFGNLGYLDLRKAMELMPQGLAYEFWVPARFDLASQAEHLVPAREFGPPGEEELSAEARELLGSAIENLKRAVEMDPDYSPGWINLAIAYRFLGQPHLARHAADEALRLEPENQELKALQAVIVAGSDPTLDMWPEATERLAALAERPDASPAVHYNLARLMEKRGREAAARVHWEWLRRQARTLPLPIRRIVCAGATDEDGECQTVPFQAIALPWETPLPLGADIYNKEMKAKLGDERWQSKTFDFGTQQMHGSVYWQPDRVAILVLNGYVDTLALYGSELGSATALRERVGSPGFIQSVAGGEIWSYGLWSAVIRDGMVVEAWIGKQPAI
jgi:tetratricopeptide (TPR) repeat protein